MSYVDLHVHSNASDGTLSPEQVVRLAHEAGLSAIALTDHDTTAGVAGAAEAGAELGLEVVPGIEVSSSFRDHEIHILGLFVDTDSPSLQAALKEFRHHRDQRNQEMLGPLSAIRVNAFPSAFRTNGVCSVVVKGISRSKTSAPAGAPP